jgi:hypothetical protein
MVVGHIGDKSGEGHTLIAKIIGAFSAIGSVVTVVAYLPQIIEGYEKTKAVYQLPAKVEELKTAQKASIGPEGPRGQQGLSGKQGDSGPQGDRGPKGDPGVTPAQLADLDRRLAVIADLQQRVASLEKRLTQTQAKPSGTEATQIANADNSSPIRLASVAGFKRHDSGCLYLTPNFQPFSYIMRIGDRFCDNNGENGSTVVKMTDSVISFNNNTCYLKNMCNLNFSNRATFNIERIDEDSRTRNNVATVQVTPRS